MVIGFGLIPFVSPQVLVFVLLITQSPSKAPMVPVHVHDADHVGQNGWFFCRMFFQMYVENGHIHSMTFPGALEDLLCATVYCWQ